MEIEWYEIVFWVFVAIVTGFIVVLWFLWGIDDEPDFSGMDEGMDDE